MGKKTSIVICGIMGALLVVLFVGIPQVNDAIDIERVAPGENIAIRDGMQYITINAKGGYSPQLSLAEAGVPTKLIMKTTETYDCSSALVIHSISYQNILPQTGETEIDIGTHQSGDVLQGVCSMGMYGFQIKFK